VFEQFRRNQQKKKIRGSRRLALPTPQKLPEEICLSGNRHCLFREDPVAQTFLVRLRKLHNADHARKHPAWPEH
jgi:hypothetical protein